MLVDDHVKMFNNHQQRHFFPSERICVDESIAGWYGQGGHWINMGLPMYVTIDRKPENGCEIQNAACSKSGVMIQLKVVKTAEEEASNQEEADDEDNHLPHGAQVLKYLVLPWANSDSAICADLYFASVTAALEMKKIGLRCIGVIKTATRRFPMAYLQGLELEKQGDRKALIRRGEGGWGIHRYFRSSGWIANGDTSLHVDPVCKKAPPTVAQGEDNCKKVSCQKRWSWKCHSLLPQRSITRLAARSIKAIGIDKRH
jgi:Transposase IS4